MCGRLPAPGAVNSARRKTRALLQASYARRNNQKEAVNSLLTDVAVRSQASTNGYGLRPINSRPAMVVATSKVPSPENRPRLSSPNSKPTLPDACIAANAVASGSSTCTIDDSRIPRMRSEANRKPTAAISRERSSDRPIKKSSTGRRNATTPNPWTIHPLAQSPTGPTQFGPATVGSRGSRRNVNSPSAINRPSARIASPNNSRLRRWAPFLESCSNNDEPTSEGIC